MIKKTQKFRPRSRKRKHQKPLRWLNLRSSKRRQPRLNPRRRKIQNWYRRKRTLTKSLQMQRPNLRKNNRNPSKSWLRLKTITMITTITNTTINMKLRKSRRLNPNPHHQLQLRWYHQQRRQRLRKSITKSTTKK